MQSFASPWVHQSLDTGHAFITHRLSGPPPDQWVREAGPLLEHVHLQDTDGNGDRHWAPGDGALNWFALFEGLRQNWARKQARRRMRRSSASARSAPTRP